MKGSKANVWLTNIPEYILGLPYKLGVCSHLQCYIQLQPTISIPPPWHHTAKPSGIETTDKYDYCLHEATDASKDEVNFHSSGTDAFAMEDDLGTP